VVVTCRAKVLSCEPDWVELEIEFPDQSPLVTSFSGKGIGLGVPDDICEIHCIMAPTGLFLRGVLPNQDLMEVYGKVAEWVDGQDPAKANWCDCESWKENYLYLGDALVCCFCGHPFRK